MFIVWLILAGLAGGIIGGMGMGGGTLLIPILTVALSVPQKTAQAINLIAFIPMAIVALIIHFKNKLVDLKDILYIVIPAIATAILSALLAHNTGSELLRKLFGTFLIIIGTIYLFAQISSEKPKPQD